MPKWADLMAREGRLLRQERELRSLRGEVDRLRLENERIRTAMRRCVPCEYRLEVVGRGKDPGQAGHG